MSQGPSRCSRPSGPRRFASVTAERPEGISRVSIFFFQAEDGIRDGRVTGVQTCALPISTIAAKKLPLSGSSTEAPAPGAATRKILIAGGNFNTPFIRYMAQLTGKPRPKRSEERRVGKERRLRGAPDPLLLMSCLLLPHL